MNGDSIHRQRERERAREEEGQRLRAAQREEEFSIEKEKQTERKACTRHNGIHAMHAQCCLWIEKKYGNCGMNKHELCD